VQDSERPCWNQNVAKGCKILQIVNRAEGDDDYDAGSIDAECVVAYQFVLATSYVLDCACSTLQFIKNPLRHFVTSW
jgi:hypothetical protein